MIKLFTRKPKWILLILAVIIAFFTVKYFFDEKPINIQGAQLPGNTGNIEGTVRSAEENKDKSGALTYGPYVKLPPGKYEIKIKYSATSDDCGSWDMIFRGSKEVMKQGKFTSKDNGFFFENLTILERDAGKELEIRSWYTGKGTLKVKELVIKKDIYSINDVLLRLFIGILVTTLIYLSANLAVNNLEITLHRENKIKYFTLILSAGFLGSVIFHYVRGMFWGRPLDTFLPSVLGFGDFFGLVDQWSRFSFSGIGYGLSYFPSTYLIASIFSILYDPLAPYYSLIPYLLFFCGFFLIYAFKNLQCENRIDSFQSVIVCFFMSYPVLFSLHTANIEIFVFMFLCMFIYLYQQGKILASTLFLALPISMKLLPAIFLILFLSDKKYKEIFYTLFFVFVLSLIPLLIFRGGLGNGLSNYFHNLSASQKMYSELMIIGPAGNHYGHSLLNAVRIIAGPSMPLMTNIIKPYFVFTMICFGTLSVYIVRHEKVYWKKVALLVISMNLLPYTSTDYKLMHLFIALFLFINSQREEKWDFLYIVLFSLLLIPKDYYYFNNNPLYTLNNVLNAFLMLTILSLIIGTNFRIIFKNTVKK